jgi:Biotin-requiring enzyme
MQSRTMHNIQILGSDHSLTNTKGVCLRFLTTSFKDGNKNHRTSTSAEDAEEARAFANYEEIVDIPAAALEDLIDRSKYTEIVPIRMPDLGTSRDNAPDRLSRVQKWFLDPGAILQQGDVLCDIQTPDFTFGMETDDEELGIMGEILVPAGQPVPDGTVLCHVYHEAKPGQKATPAAPSPVEDDDEEEDDGAMETAATPEEEEEDDEDRGKPIDPSTTHKP